MAGNAAQRLKIFFIQQYCVTMAYGNKTDINLLMRIIYLPKGRYWRKTPGKKDKSKAICKI